jgi:hypothetical protein
MKGSSYLAKETRLERNLQPRFTFILRADYYWTFTVITVFAVMLPAVPVTVTV